ncbi:sodium-dependent dopamine transporter-like [Pieris brassicae]|uniref:sodium-dependent dopamine transporter-like n=1 Tax=Pieris brassicae TaxID=7116 RepID=UPI001E662590|nr:sodium-dependent dopamine transporter-like [Pieris brassicae]
MHKTTVDLTTSTSTSFSDKNEFHADVHFRWDSIKKFIYIGYAYSSSIFSFDIFSKVVIENMTLVEFIVSALTIGMAYMFMDFFIKQYTRKLDTNENLNPLLRGVSFGILLQTTLLALINATNLADSLRFLAITFLMSPGWVNCQKAKNAICIPSEDVVLRCKAKNITNILTTSVHFHYEKLFINFDRNNLSTKFFIIAIVWLFNFFISTIADRALLKLFKITFLWRTLSTLFIVIVLLFTSYTTTAFYQILDLTQPRKKYPSSLSRANEIFGVGLIGVYDFGTMSPFTMIDTTVVIFTVVTTAIAFARSLIVRSLYTALSGCIEIKIAVTPHYLLFVMIPLSVEFMDLHKLYVFYVYLNLTVALVPGLAMLTLTISKLLHNEFRSVKYIYIIGISCFMGFALSLPLTVMPINKLNGLMMGQKLSSLYLGGLKALIVMWMYGVKKFSADIQFWLGFKPTLYWRTVWMLLPATFCLLTVNKINDLSKFNDIQQQILAFVWVVFSFLIVAVFQIKTIARYILQSNLLGILRSSTKYGPIDPDDRKRRKCFDETVTSRQCRHNCIMLSEKFECNHLPLIFKRHSKISNRSSLRHIFDAGATRNRESSVVDISYNNFN